MEELANNSSNDYLEDHDHVNKSGVQDLLQEASNDTFSSRRDFLKFFGFSIASSALIAGCEQPVNKAIPYLFKPEEVIPGKSNYYASTFFDGDDFSSILVKVRDGRPIKIEGNDLAGEGTSSRMQASVLELYDTSRLSQPVEGSNNITWEEADQRIAEGLNSLSRSGKKTVILTGTVISPSTRQIISEFVDYYPGMEWIQYDPLSFSAMLEANSAFFKRRVIPSIYFDKAELIVSFGADFLGTWLMPVRFARQYAEGRRVNGDNPSMSRHVHFESSLSLTGANADERIPVRTDQLHNILVYLYEKLRGNNPASLPGYENVVDELADQLKEKAGRSIIVCGYNDKTLQELVNGINLLLGNYGQTLDINRPVYLRSGNDAAMHNLTQEMNRGEIGALLIHNVNPVYDLPDGEDFARGLEKVELKVSMAMAQDETSVLCDFVCPDHHYLESWGDAEPVRGYYSLQQPVIRPLGNTRQLQDNLLLWSGEATGYHDYLKNFWENNIFPLTGVSASFVDFWNDCLQKGILELPYIDEPQPSVSQQSISDLLSGLPAAPENDGMLVMEICQNIAIGSGRHANNPWLQELPDPVSKICWDNYLAVSPSDARSLFLSSGDVVLLNNKLRIPVLVQPGQASGTVSAAMGYGRRVSGKVARGVGVNVMPLGSYRDGYIQYGFSVSSIEKTGEEHKLAHTQTHHSMEGRAIVREASLREYRNNPYAGNEMRKKVLDHKYTLYDEVEHTGLHWAMSIDLNACTGCSACATACQAENNIPVIGKDEVYRRRIMHWIRIDRYYSGESDNPSVHFMPVMCQHCDNAPCENVCPVAATNHSDEGLNQMAYVRCIGTKYCINNCPYKVRRFNWFNYTGSDDFDFHMNNEKGRLVLNPDVTVRERGIVEKCSFCIQRIQEAKIKAKAENRVLGEDEITPACAQACPSKAIVFGNIADKNSRIYKLFREKRNYHLLEELHTLPSVGYLTRIKNK